MIAASGALVMISGLGAIIGPDLVAVILDKFENQALFGFFAVVHAVTGGFPGLPQTAVASAIRSTVVSRSCGWPLP